MGTILIKRSAVAWTHEQVRFLEPAHGTAQVRAIYCEDLKRFTILPPDPTRNVCCCTIPRTREGIAIGCQPRLIFREAFHRPQCNPRLVRLSLPKTGENVTNHRNRKQRPGDGVERHTESQKKTPSGYGVTNASFDQRFLFRFSLLASHDVVPPKMRMED